MREYVLLRLENSDRLAHQLGLDRFGGEFEDAISVERRRHFERKQAAAVAARRTKRREAS
jgi:hypothetical protein